MDDVGEPSALGEGRSGVTRAQLISESRGEADKHQHSAWFGALVRKHYMHGGPVRIEHITDAKRQLLGHDLHVYAAYGLVDVCEVKFRDKVRADILLERYHEDVRADGSVVPDTKRSGWMNRNLQCTRFMNVFVPNKSLIVMAWADLKHAWWEHREEWCKIDAWTAISTRGNLGYRTVSTAVPLPVLRKLFPVFTVTTP